MIPITAKFPVAKFELPTFNRRSRRKKVISGSNKDDERLVRHHKSEEQRKELIARFCKAGDPLSILVVSDQPRELAGALLQLADVAGIDLGEDSKLTVRARNPRRFFADFTRLVLEEGFRVDHLETLDDSTHAVLGYLLGGRA